MKKLISVFLSFVIFFTGVGLSEAAFASSVPSVSINAITSRPGGFAVSWKRPSGVNGYQIQYSTSNKFPSGGYKLVEVAGQESYGKTVSGCMSNRTYYVRLRAYKNTNGKKQYSAWSASKPIATRNRNEANSTTITGISGRPGGYYITWNKVSNATGYQIQHSTSSKFPSGKGSKTTTLGGANVVSKQISGCMSNRTYYVRVRTYHRVDGKDYYSPWSTAKSVSTRHKNEANPTTISHIYSNGTSFKVVWEKEATAGGYQIQYSTDKKFPSNNCTYLYTDGTDSTSRTVSKLKANTTYYVRVRTRKVVNNKRYYSQFSDIQAVNLSKISVTSVKITDQKGKTVEKGSKLQLHANVSPSKATNKKIIWTSSDKTKATVDSNGVVTAIRPTEYVLITATSKDGSLSDSYELKITANNGYLTKSDLDKLKLGSYNNLMIVAHPDDETLWGGSHLIKDNYFVVVLTNSYKDLRKSEFQEAMSKTKDKYVILAYPDLKNTWYDENGKYKYSTDSWSTCKSGITKDLELILNYKNWDTIVTHNPDGEYGHYHHKLTSSITTDIVDKNIGDGQNFYYFGNFYKKNETNPEQMLSKKDYTAKDKIAEIYVPSSPYAIANNRHMVPYENWIPANQWENLKK